MTRPILIALSLLVAVSCEQPAPQDTQPDIPPAAEWDGVTPPDGQATPATAAHNARIAEQLPIADQGDFQDVRRGLLAQLDKDIVRSDGTIVWRVHAYDFLGGDAPETVNPSLWRQSQLTAQHGLFEVVDGIYQVRGYDVSVMSIIRGETGWIIVDPLFTTETAVASLALVNDTLGERPVSAVIYTHSHVDHFGGVRGVVPGRRGHSDYCTGGVF